MNKPRLIAAAMLLHAGAAMAATYYVAPTGNDSNAGTLAAPFASFARAQTAVVAGDTVYFRGGSYVYTAALASCASMTDTVTAIAINKAGANGRMIKYWAYPGETPVFDFSQMTDNCRVKGFAITSSYIHLKGLEVKGAPQQPGNLLNNESWGIYIASNNNIVEQVNTHHHMGPGLFLANGYNNLILNVDSHHNYDPYSKSGAGQNADGFGAHITGTNKPNNIFRGCRAWMNSDDGFDLINAGTSVLIENSWAWLHGYLPGTTTSLPAGNGNGFKIGGFGGDWEANGQPHIVRNSVAFRNKSSGFYANHHTVASYFYNNTASGNRYNYNMLGVAPDNTAINLGILRNNLSISGTATANVAGTDMANNSWDSGVTVGSADFQSVSTEGWDAPRLPDGSLPPLPNFHLVAGSDLVDAGVDVGLPYTGVAPDLGAFEGSTPITAFTDVTAKVKVTQSGLTLDRATQQTKGTVSFTNTGSSDIKGTLLLRLDYLSSGVTLANASGSQGGAPTVAVPDTTLSPGETVTVTTSFANPGRVAIGYAPKLLAGAQ